MLKRTFTWDGLGVNKHGNHMEINPNKKDYDEKIIEEYDVVIKEKYNAISRILKLIKEGLDKERDYLFQTEEKEGYANHDRHTQVQNWIRQIDKRAIYTQISQAFGLWKLNYDNYSFDEFETEVEKEMKDSGTSDTDFDAKIQKATEVAKKIQLNSIKELEGIEKSIYEYRNFFE